MVFSSNTVLLQEQFQITHLFITGRFWLNFLLFFLNNECFNLIGIWHFFSNFSLNLFQPLSEFTSNILFIDRFIFKGSLKRYWASIIYFTEVQSAAKNIGKKISIHFVKNNLIQSTAYHQNLILCKINGRCPKSFKTPFKYKPVDK